ncbi:MAG: CDP-alcohol phosphatidyltransferase family protein [Anaerolineales bacterium]
MQLADTHPDRNRLRTLRAWAVHLYTSLGNIAAFLALIAIADDRPRDVFIFLALAIFIDSTDGVLARAWDISRWTPNFDGRKLDDITDYLTYVFIPMYFAYAYKLVAEPWTPVLGVVLLASAFGFCQDWAKTEDGFFTGFPSYWNVVVFYLYLLQWPVAVNGLLLFVLALLVFVPIRYVYPTKTKFWMPVTLLGSAVWGVLLAWLVVTFERPDPLVLQLSLLYPVYYFALSLFLHFRPRSISRK